MRYHATPSSPKIREAMRAGRIDYITTPLQGNALMPGIPFIADNGAYGKGFPGEAAWWKWVASVPPEDCRFVTAPDVVGDAKATLDRSLPWLPAIRSVGHKAALVGQDGMKPAMIPWDELDAFFVGGGTEWKLGAEAAELVGEARNRGKWAHMGRVNSRKRLRYADSIGCQSADGTYLAFGPDVNLPKLLRWLDEMEAVA